MASRTDLQTEAGRRIAFLFLRTLGSSLGIIERPKNPQDTPRILNQPHFDAVLTDIKILLTKKWVETELKERVFQAYREKRHGVTRVSELVTGAVPIAGKKDPNRNLIETVPRRWHPQLAKRVMPTVSIVATETGIRAETVKRSEVGPLIEKFTLEDLRGYWEDAFHGYRLRESGEALFGSLSWTVDSNDLSDILWAIDGLADQTSRRDDSPVVSVFDLETHLKDQSQESVRATQWMNR